MFSIGNAPFYISTNSAQGFQFLCIFANTLFSRFGGFLFLFFESRHPNGYEVTSHCGFNLYFFKWLVRLRLFSCALLAICVFFHFFLISLARVLSILLIFSKNQLWFHWCFCCFSVICSLTFALVFFPFFCLVGIQSVLPLAF